MKLKNHRFGKNLNLVRWPSLLFKSFAWLVIVTFSVRCLTPAVLAAETLKLPTRASAADAEFDAGSKALIKIENLLDRMNRRLNGQFEFAWQETLAKRDHSTAHVAATRADLGDLSAQLATAYDKFEAVAPKVSAYLANSQTQLKLHHTASVIQQRAAAQAAKIAQLRARFDALMKAINDADTPEAYKIAVGNAAAFMDAHSSKPKRAPFDPHNLAFGPSGYHARKPLTDAAAIRAALHLGSTEATTESATTNGSVPADLAPTEDVQITPAIIAKAKALDNNPLKIYQFVRNNVEFLPTYGSIQGSDYTLQTMRGNAMDQASLLIALLRAANIPARYVYGTIRVPIAQVENWVGNVTDPMAAMNLMGQGGIPVTGLSQGGVIKYARLEHVWVEAKVDYNPSRGAINKTPDTWVPMDPSFKQYTYTDGMDLKAKVPFDTQAFADHITSTATVNTSQGWVKGVDQNYVQNQVAAYQRSLKNYVAQNDPHATIGDVLGTKTIVTEQLPLLPASLPYAVVTKGYTSTALPDSLRWKLRYTVGGADMLAGSLPTLAGHTLAVHFVPASAQDTQTLRSYFPETLTDPDQLPESLPAGVVGLTATVSIDGQDVKAGSTYRLGDSVQVSGSIYQPGNGWATYNGSPLTAGDYQVIALATSGISGQQLHDLQNKVKTIQNGLAANPNATAANHDLTAQMLESVAIGYFIEIYSKSHLMARAATTVQYRLPSFGTVSIGSAVRYFFGVPMSYAPKGIVMDMTRLATMAVDKSGDGDRQTRFNQASGVISSSHENSIAESLLSTDNERAEGVSAAISLALAAGQGQKIFKIGANNGSTALSTVNASPEVKAEIANAINAGQTVTVQSGDVERGGVAVLGYIIEDPTTGAAAYKISTGQNGGWTNFITGGEGVCKYLWELTHFGDDFSKLFKGLEGLFSAIGAASTAWDVYNDLKYDCGATGAASVGIAWAAVSWFMGEVLYAAIAALILTPLFAIVLIFAIGFFLSLFQEMIESIAKDICRSI